MKPNPNPSGNEIVSSFVHQYGRFTLSSRGRPPQRLDLGGAVAEKLEYNAKRLDHKPENRRADGGKKY